MEKVSGDGKSMCTKTISFWLLFFGISSIVITAAMAESGDSSTPVAPSAVYIVYTEKPIEGVEPESHHLGTLSTVLGSDEAARDALIYVYKSAATGFSAKLTPEQVAELSKQPGVIEVVPSRTYQLHSGSSGAGLMKMPGGAGMMNMRSS